MRKDVYNNLCSGRPSTSTTFENVQKIKNAIRIDCISVCRDIASIVNIYRETIRHIQELHMRKVCAKLVLKFFSEEQKEL